MTRDQLGGAEGGVGEAGADTRESNCETGTETDRRTEGQAGGQMDGQVAVIIKLG